MRVKFPKYLNSPNKILIFDADEFSVAFSTILVPTVIFKNPILIIVGLLITGLYIKAKKYAPKSFFKHLPYYIGIKNFRNFPHSFTEEFYE